MPDLSRPRDALACSNRLSNRPDRDRSRPVIQGAINARDVSLLLMHPLEEGSDLIQCQGGRESARQIHMDFIRTTRRIRAQFSDAA